MIKISKFVYIHFTTVFLFAVCYINRRLGLLAAGYSAIFLHELAHLAAALFIGLKPSRIVFFPFGVNLKLKNTIVYSVADEIILYIAGPLSNIIMALLSTKISGALAKTFYYNNICLFIFNMLPIMPMDGAVIMKKIMSRRVGSRRAEKVLCAVSCLLICLLICGEVYLAINNKFNYTVIFTLIFLTANIFTNKEKYHLDFTRELMFYRNKDDFNFKKAKVYIIKDGTNLRSLAENFAQGHHYIIVKENKFGKINEIMSEREIIDRLLE